MTRPRPTARRPARTQPRRGARSRGARRRRPARARDADRRRVALAVATARSPCCSCPSCSHLPVLGRSLAEYAETRPPLPSRRSWCPGRSSCLRLRPLPQLGPQHQRLGRLRGAARPDRALGGRLERCSCSCCWRSRARPIRLGFIAVFWGCEIVAVPVCRAVGRAAFWQSSAPVGAHADRRRGRGGPPARRQDRQAPRVPPRAGRLPRRRRAVRRRRKPHRAGRGQPRGPRRRARRLRRHPRHHRLLARPPPADPRRRARLRRPRRAGQHRAAPLRDRELADR